MKTTPQCTDELPVCSQCIWVHQARCMEFKPLVPHLPVVAGMSFFALDDPCVKSPVFRVLWNAAIIRLTRCG